jgi:hypothetical protein
MGMRTTNSVNARIERDRHGSWFIVDKFVKGAGWKYVEILLANEDADYMREAWEAACLNLDTELPNG